MKRTNGFATDCGIKETRESTAREKARAEERGWQERAASKTVEGIP